MLKSLGVAAFMLAVFCPCGFGADSQLSVKAKWFTAGKDEFGNTIEYFGQSAQSSTIILTSSNGFFDKGIVAKGVSKMRDAANGLPPGKTKGHPQLISRDFEYLDGWKSSDQVMRWHMWFENQGDLEVSLKLKPENPAATIVVCLGEQVRRARVAGLNTAEGKLPFKVASRGKQTLAIKAELNGAKQVGKLYSVQVTGSAAKNAKLLRARWRPGAVHGSYRSSQMSDTDMWVMVSRSESPCSSYSPITTPFGYYGGSFGADRRFQGGFNFSMWSNADLPTERQAHLLALGSPRAEFSGFGHEGTGVKPRGWSPLEDSRPKEVVQFLRVENTSPYKTYYGYFLDPKTRDWKLYCVGRKWAGADKKREKPLWPGSFVEVPGPPQSQRSGDLIRRVLRKGWCRDKQGKWRRLDVLPAGKRNHQNKSWGVTKDGWFCFTMGGMEHFTSAKKDIKLSEQFINEPLPDFLAPEKVKQLYKLPVKFGAIAAEPSRDSAALSIDLKDAGTNANAIVYYGQKDCLTFAPRKKHGTERKHSTLRDDGVWPHSRQLSSAKTGMNSLALTNLKPGTKYFYRILVVNDQGKTWSFETHSFTTK
jgi:hypothetical protein